MAKPLYAIALLASASALPLYPARGQISHTTIDEPAVPPAGPGAKTTAAKPHRATVEDVVVIGARRRARGGGLIKPETRAKAVSTVSSEFIAKQAAIQNAYQYVSLAPGVAVAQSDAYGLSEQGSINVRGLGQDEIGYVLEGMPLNDLGYYVGYPSQFIDSENIDEITLSQGSAELDSPVVSAAGGLMNISMLDPASHPGGNVALSYGSYHAQREFLRLNSGLIGDTGVRAFIAFSHTGADNWRGPGRDKRTHVDFKVVKEWSEGNRAALVGTYHDGITTNYPQPTLAAFRAYGRTGLDDLSGTYVPGNANYWPLWVGTWRLFYTSFPVQLNLADDLHFEGTPYFQYNNGNTPYGSTLAPSGNYLGTAGPYRLALPNVVNGVATVQANYNEYQYRTGLNPKFTYDMGPQKLVFGYWYDYGDEVDIESYSGLSQLGLSGDLWANNQSTLIRLPGGRLYLAGGDHVITQTNMPFFSDTFSLLGDKLTLEAGFKEAVVRRVGTNNVPGPQYGATLNSAEPLPRLAVRYKIDAHNQVYFNATTNFRTPAEATLFDTYTAGAVSTLAPRHQACEYSILQELGYRYNGPLLTASIAAFNYDFTHRQVTTLVGDNYVAETIDAGGQTSRGVDVEAGLQPWHHLSPYVSAEYLHATEDNNFPVVTANGRTDYLPTAGKTAIRSPKFTAGLGLTYDDGTLFSSFTFKYIGSEYSTFMDDEKIPSHSQADMSIGYRFPKIGLAGRPEIRLNVINLADANFLSGVATPTANAVPAIGKYGSLIPGASPLYYIAGGFAAMVTAQQAF
jgi:hypothetical protein